MIRHVTSTCTIVLKMLLLLAFISLCLSLCLSFCVCRNKDLPFSYLKSVVSLIQRFSTWLHVLRLLLVVTTYKEKGRGEATTLKAILLWVMLEWWCTRITGFMQSRAVTDYCNKQLQPMASFCKLSAFYVKNTLPFLTYSVYCSFR